MEVTDLLFWITIAVLGGALLMLIGDKLIVNMVAVNVGWKPGL